MGDYVPDVDIKEIVDSNILNAYEMVSCDVGPIDHYCPQLKDVYDDFFLNMIDDIEEEVCDVFGDEEVTQDRVDFLGIDTKGIPPIKYVRSILDGLNIPYFIGERLFNSLQLRFF